MRYWIYLSWQYMLRHKSRTIYSILGILLTYVMCFSVLTTGFSLWDYAYETIGVEHSQLWVNWSEGDMDGLTQKTIDEIKVLDRCEEVRHLWIYNYTPLETEESDGNEDVQSQRECSVEDLQLGDYCDIEIQLKDFSDLQGSAATLGEKTGLDICIDVEVADYLGQSEDSFAIYFYRSVVAVLAAIVALFSIMIIRNTLMISVVERMRDYGVYRCVGMSRKQLYQLLAVEGLFMSFAAVLLGLGIAYGFLQGITPWLNRALALQIPFHFGMHYQAVLYTAVICIAVTLYALLEPSRQAVSLSPIEAIQNNIVLRNRKGRLRENLAYHKGVIWGKIFGISGEYAYKNLQRNRGRFGGLFVSLLLCMVMAGLTESFSASLYATVENTFQGKKIEYLEAISPTGVYDEKLVQKVQKDLAAMDSVRKTGLIMGGIDLSVFDDRQKKYLGEDSVGYINHSAYDGKDLQELEKYLIEGSIDYDVMTRENGVLLCDMEYNVSDKRTDFEQKDLRRTDYQVGDRISCFSSAGRKKSMQIYNDTLQALAEKEGIPATREDAVRLWKTKGIGEPVKSEDSDDLFYFYLENCSEGDEGFERYRQEFIQMLGKQGIDLLPQINGMRSIMEIKDYMDRWLYDHGETVEYQIVGILFENPFQSLDTIAWDVQFIHTVDAVVSEGVLDEFGFWGWYIAVKRDPSTIQDGVLRQYCESNNLGRDSYQNIFEGLDGYDMNEYFDMLHTMKVIRTISVLIIASIALICMIEIYNTLCANIALRAKELWMYEVVGMSRWQEKWMLLLEHGAAAITAIPVGYLIARGSSRYFIEHIFNQDGSIQYIWSAPSVLLTGAVILVLTIIVCMAGIGGVRKR